MSLSSVRVHLQLMQSQNWLPWQRPLHARSRLCLHWIACPRKPTPRIKQRLASCHTAEVMSIQSLSAAPPPTPRAQPISEMGGGPPPCLVWTCSHSHRLTLFFLDFPILPTREWRGSKCRFWAENLQNCGFRPSNLLGGPYEHPYRR